MHFIFALLSSWGIIISPAVDGHTAFSHSIAGKYDLPWDLNRVDEGYWERIGFYQYIGPITPLHLSVESPLPQWPEPQVRWLHWLTKPKPTPQTLAQALKLNLIQTLNASKRFQVLSQSNHVALNWSVTLQAPPPLLESNANHPDVTSTTIQLTTHLSDPQGKILWETSASGHAEGLNAGHRALKIAIHKAVIQLIQRAPRYQIQIPILHIEGNALRLDLTSGLLENGEVLKAYYRPAPSFDASLEPQDRNLDPRYVGDVRIVSQNSEGVWARGLGTPPSALAPGDFVVYEKPVPPSEWADRWHPIPLLPLPFTMLPPSPL